MSRYIRTVNLRSIVPDPAPCVFAAIRFMATLLAAGIASVYAMAADVKIGEVAIRLPPPERYCELDAVVGSDAARIGPVHATLNKAGVRLLAMSAVCAELKAWRLDPTKDLDHWAEYQTAIRLRALPYQTRRTRSSANTAHRCAPQRTSQFPPLTPRNDPKRHRV